MQLDRFTEKAQEAIVAAQELAARLNIAGGLAVTLRHDGRTVGYLALGGFVAGLLGIAATNIIMQIIVAFVGAVILLVILRAVGVGRSRSTT